MKKIAVVGTGYVGLVTGTCFAETGNLVTCVDIDPKKVERLKNGEIPIYEPHLDFLFERNIRSNRLHFTTDLAEGIQDAEIIFFRCFFFFFFSVARSFEKHTFAYILG